MNMEIINSKNNYQPDAVNNRLISIEKTLQQIMQSLGSNTQNSTIIDKSSDFLKNLSLSPMKIGKMADLNRTVTNHTKMSDAQQKSNKNNLLLSHGQMVAELAMAIMRANGRNS